MCPTIDKKKTGKLIETFMELNDVKPKDIQKRLKLKCVQTVYRWINGESLPSLEVLYALSEMLGVSMDTLITGNRETIYLKRIISKTINESA